MSAETIVSMFGVAVTALFGLLVWIIKLLGSKAAQYIDSSMQTNEQIAQSTDATSKSTEATTALLLQLHGDIAEYQRNFDDPEKFSTVKTNRALRHAAEIAKHWAERQEDDRLIKLAEEMKRSVQ